MLTPCTKSVICLHRPETSMEEAGTAQISVRDASTSTTIKVPQQNLFAGAAGIVRR
jgi:hypothetical protein